MEFAKLLSEKKDPEEEVKLHLVTSNNEEYIDGAKEAFEFVKQINIDPSTGAFDDALKK